MKKLSIFLITLFFLSSSLGIAAEQKTKPQPAKPQAKADEFAKMSGEQLLEKVRKIDYVKMTEKDKVAVYQKIFNRLAAVDIKKDGMDGVKVYVAFMNFNYCLQQGTSKSLTRKEQDMLVDQLSKGLKDAASDAFSKSIEAQRLTDEQLQQKWANEKAQKEAQEAQMTESKANFEIDQVKNFGTDVSVGIKKLQDMKKKAPASKIVNDGIALLEKIKVNMQKVEFKPTEPVSDPMSKKCEIQVSNKSELKLSRLGILVSFLDSKGKVLKTEEYQANAENMTPPQMNGCPPGYEGAITMVSPKDAGMEEKWVKTTVKLKFVVFSFE